MLRVGVGALLIASLVGNVLLLLTRHAESMPEERAPTASVEHRCPLVPPSPAPSPVTTVPTESVVLPPARAKVECATLEKRLEETEAKLDHLLPIREKFERAQRSPETEMRARKILDKVIGSLSASEHSYDVECHAVYCKLEILDESISTNDWMSAVQGSLGFSSWSFGRDGTYAQLPGPAQSAQGLLVSAIGNAVLASPELAACKKQNPTKGTMTMLVTLTATRRLIVSTSGPLASEPVGGCARKAMEDLLRGIQIPAEVQSMPDLPIPFPEMSTQ
jgi:hypothetical protein